MDIIFFQYVAVKGERVLGVVTKTGKVHKVDIGSAHLASLPELAFQGATRRNKPTLQVPPTLPEHCTYSL